MVYSCFLAFTTTLSLEHVGTRSVGSSMEQISSFMAQDRSGELEIDEVKAALRRVLRHGRLGRFGLFC